MTAKMMHLAMWYAGHDPCSSSAAALARGGAYADYGFSAIFFAHLAAAYPTYPASDPEC